MEQMNPPEVTSVRASRDGDQFHYIWAARRCLQLLSKSSGLVAITIEGVSPFEASSERLNGEEVIDVGEYYGSDRLASAARVTYIQLKHSTKHASIPWTPSGLRKSLNGFVRRYRDLQQQFPSQLLASRFEFWFISNRPIASDILATIEDVANEAPVRHPTVLRKLEQYAGMNGNMLSGFCKLLRVEGGQDDYWNQRNILFQEVKYYLPDCDIDAPTQLKELVTRKALSENAANPVITKIDVLRVLRTDESQLFPAPCLLSAVAEVVPREQESELINRIVQAGSIPVIIYAEGGVGKSVFATRIARGLPQGSSSVLYDCFGNGRYRSPTGYRHRHKDGLVQVANELAGKGLCHPLIPTVNADATAYLRTFLYRLKQSSVLLRANNKEAVLCIIIDAADNSEMAAKEANDGRSFVRDLLREEMPEGVRLVALCRTHRQDYLDPPPEVLRLELLPFSETETAANLRRVFPDATTNDVEEFHRLSSHNPRVQALALSWKKSLDETLRLLGPNPTTVEDTIGNLLDRSITKLRDTAGAPEQSQIDSICAALAVLRPLIPIPVLAAISGVPAAAIKSFASDLGRPLVVLDDTIQFFDEPAETWFKERFKPKREAFDEFLNRLAPLAGSSAYVASVLPHLLLEADHLQELVALALSSEGLPQENPLDSRDVELQRLQFALKASLRAQRQSDAVKLAMKAGGEMAGDQRQQRLLQANTDLASVLMETESIQEIVSRGTFGSQWIGSHHAYEAGMMSWRPALAAEARSRLRMAHEWLNNWSSLSDEEKQQERIQDRDIAEMAMAHFNLHGAASCARHLRVWHPRTVSFRAGRILAKRFIDQIRYDDLNELARAAEEDIYLVLAITVELRQARRIPPKMALERIVQIVRKRQFRIEESSASDTKPLFLNALTALVECCHLLAAYPDEDLGTILKTYLPTTPSRGDFSRHSPYRTALISAYSLRAAIAGGRVQLEDLAHPELRTLLEKERSYHSQEASEFNRDVGAVLPWYNLRSEALLGRISVKALPSAIEAALAESSRSLVTGSSGAAAHIFNEIASVWLEILVDAEATEPTSLQTFNQWISKLSHPLYPTTLTRLARLCARTEPLTSYALDYAEAAFRRTKDERDDAEAKANAYIDLARAILSISKPEATEYFNEAVRVASRIGDENLDRWSAVLDLAERAGSPVSHQPKLAYNMARAAELTYAYVDRDKHFDWTSTVCVIAGLSPASVLAILSRWRDRAFGWPEKLLPPVINFLLKNRVLDPLSALALIGFRAHWNSIELLSEALNACGSLNQKRAVSEYFYTYFGFESVNAEKWRSFQQLLTANGIVIAGVNEAVAFFDRTIPLAGKNKSGSSQDSRLSYAASERDWNQIFDGVSLTSAGEIAACYQRFKSHPPPLIHDEFFRQACVRVAAGAEAEFLRAFADISEFELFHLRSLIGQIPASWSVRLSARATLRRIVKLFCGRFCLEFSFDRYYDLLPFDLIETLTGLTKADMAAVALSAMGQTQASFNARRLFTMVGLLATNLTTTEAAAALTFGIDLLNPAFEETDGDGRWSAELEPGGDVSAALAGYVWAGLASPKACVRWEAAHVVRGLCSLGCSNVMLQLLPLAFSATGGAFADHRLTFYDLHARLWLLMALARVAKEAPKMIVPWAAFLQHCAFEAGPHFMIRDLSSRIALTLSDQRLICLPLDVQDRLRTVNKSQFPISVVEKYGPREMEPHTSDEDSDERFYFGMDVDTFLFAPLARCFGVSQAAVERAATLLVKTEWNWPADRAWEQDERRRKGIFKDNEAWHSRSSYPRTDDLGFYLAYHATMIVAGRLLQTKPLQRDPDEPEDSFAEWISRHGLSRLDGNWLADRRDRTPLDWSPWKNDEERDDWRWSLARNDFERVLLPSERLINLWGRWTVVSGRRMESVNIHSALVPSSRSEALLRSLHTSDPYSYYIGNSDREPESSVSAAFQIKDWVANSCREDGLDTFDPWSGDIRYPPIVPAGFVVDLMNLTSDSEERQWIMGEDSTGSAALWSQVWGQTSERDETEDRENGRRIQTSSRFLCKFLNRIEMDLIISVEMERGFSRSRYERSNDVGYMPPSVRIFLAKSDGTIITI